MSRPTEKRSAVEIAEAMSDMRGTKPSSLARMFGINGPTEAQREAYDARVRAWNREYRALVKAHKVALERDNAAFRSEKRSREAASIALDATTLAARMNATEKRSAASIAAPATIGTLALEYVFRMATDSDPLRGPSEDEALVDLRALMAERDRLRAALDDCAHRARRIMGSVGYQDDDNAAWIGPDMHAIVDHANREGVKP